MIDLPAYTTVASHYEYVVQDFRKERTLKEQIYKEMEQLEGWCTNSKASVMMDLVFNHRPQVIVEVGVWGGKSFIPMAIAQKSLKIGGVIYGIDPWQSSASVMGFDGANQDWWSKVDHEKIYQQFAKKLQQFELLNNAKIIRQTSEDAPEIENIDLIHIDGNHSEDSALFDVQKWVPLVREGGFIIFDDLDWATTRKAVRWLDEHCTRIITFHEVNAWGIWINIPK